MLTWFEVGEQRYETERWESIGTKEGSWRSDKAENRQNWKHQEITEYAEHLRIGLIAIQRDWGRLETAAERSRWRADLAQKRVGERVIYFDKSQYSNKWPYF